MEHLPKIANQVKNGGKVEKIVESIKASKGAAEAIANAKYTRTLLQSMRGFMDDVASVVAKQGITIEKFTELRLKPLEKLTESEKSIMKVIRESISMPDNTTIMQKVIPKGDIAKYIDGTYTQVGGYVTKAQDVKQLKNYNNIYQSLRLDYPGTVYNQATDDVLGVIRFKTPQASNIKIPYGKEMGGSVTDSFPFTGNGFTSATNGQTIPEFTCNSRLNLYDGAELYEVGKDGREVLRAIFDDEIGKFVSIIK
ncbi:hypothetical protein Q6375_14000 [Clostridium septicum]|uniref:hypothetical protein n=1 Tax=Clostridium septicum TaxID=1504 RepID=UPI00272E5383|nr:hypothetical protein [Clostridium septicum]WLF69074.1 hypothetical protein Q6375_14000 [Clostridium septicum]